MLNCRMPCHVEPPELTPWEHLEFRLTPLHQAGDHILWAQPGSIGRYKHVQEISKYLLRRKSATIRLFTFNHPSKAREQLRWKKIFIL